MESDESHWAFAPLGMSTSHGGGFQNIGVGNQLLFNGQAGCVLDPMVGKWKMDGTTVTHLSSGDDNVLAPVLDAYRTVGMHDGQVTAVKVTAPESFLGCFFVCEILQDPKRKCKMTE